MLLITSGLYYVYRDLQLAQEKEYTCSPESFVGK